MVMQSVGRPGALLLTSEPSLPQEHEPKVMGLPSSGSSCSSQQNLFCFQSTPIFSSPQAFQLLGI